jgi:hypothetical protein
MVQSKKKGATAMIFEILNGCVIIDDDDFEKINSYKWYLGGGYAIAKTKEMGKHKTIRMHRVINNTPRGWDTDHINGNKLDNRKQNLRTASRSQNSQNSKIYKNSSSGKKGVSYDKNRNKWVARICKNGMNIFLGRFDTKDDAVSAYNKKAISVYGENAFLNDV